MLLSFNAKLHLRKLDESALYARNALLFQIPELRMIPNGLSPASAPEIGTRGRCARPGAALGVVWNPTSKHFGTLARQLQRKPDRATARELPTS